MSNSSQYKAMMGEVHASADLIGKVKVSSNLSRYHRSPGLVPAISKRRYRE